MPFCLLSFSLLSLLLFLLLLLLLLSLLLLLLLLFCSLFKLVKVDVNDKTNCKTHSLQLHLFTPN